MTTLIYALSDPATGKIRYVGMTRQGLRERLRKHVSAAKSVTIRNHRTNWISSLGSEPMMTVLDEITGSSEEAATVERRWIARLRSEGCGLINATDGGEGALGLKHTAESKAKISAAKLGHKHTAEERERMSLQRRGRKMPPRSPEHCAKISAKASARAKRPEWRAHLLAIGAATAASARGTKRSPEFCAKIAACKLGRKQTAEHRAAISRGKALAAERRRMSIVEIGR